MRMEERKQVYTYSGLGMGFLSRGVTQADMKIVETRQDVLIRAVIFSAKCWKNV